MNYGELRAFIADWLHRSDMDSAIGRCVAMATSHFNRVLRTPEMESRDVRPVTSEFVTVPSDFLEIISITRDDGRELRYLARPQFASYVGLGMTPEPPIFCVEDYQFRFLPAPTVDSPLNVTILYYEGIANLVNDSDTNWLLSAFPDAYLYGALMHARVWLHDDPRVQLIKPMFDEMLAQMQRRRVAATGIAKSVGFDMPTTGSSFDIVRGY